MRSLLPGKLLSGPLGQQRCSERYLFEKNTSESLSKRIWLSANKELVKFDFSISQISLALY